jgi:large subunit ribosomal protein L19
MVNIINDLTQQQMRKDLPDFKVGDTVKVYTKVVEKNKVRIRSFEGIVIAFHNKGISKTFTVRKISYGIGVERIFPLHSPTIEKIEIMKRGKVRRAKLYYLREKIGKAAKVKDQV